VGIQEAKEKRKLEPRLSTSELPCGNWPGRVNRRSCVLTCTRGRQNELTYMLHHLPFFLYWSITLYPLPAFFLYYPVYFVKIKCRNHSHHDHYRVTKLGAHCLCSKQKLHRHSSSSMLFRSNRHCRDICERNTVSENDEVNMECGVHERIHQGMSV
jgi:hypothetical protein